MHVVLPTLDAALTVLEKDRFQAFAVRHDLPVPRGWTPQTREELESVIESENLSFPVVLKPQRSGEWRSPDAISALGLVKMLRADSVAQLREQWAKVVSLAGPPVLQEYVRGDDDTHATVISDVAGRNLSPSAPTGGLGRTQRTTLRTRHCPAGDGCPVRAFTP
jgi:predicted ATP-grasp superfamily ATP-dependent carboligase